MISIVQPCPPLLHVLSGVPIENHSERPMGCFPQAGKASDVCSAHQDRLLILNLRACGILLIGGRRVRDPNDI
jgi:hypothetical protein